MTHYHLTPSRGEGAFPYSKDDDAPIQMCCEHVCRNASCFCIANFGWATVAASSLSAILTMFFSFDYLRVSTLANVDGNCRIKMFIKAELEVQVNLETVHEVHLAMQRLRFQSVLVWTWQVAVEEVTMVGKARKMEDGSRAFKSTRT